MIRVLEVCYGLGYGGIRSCIQNYVSHMNHNEFHVDIYAFGTSESPFLEQFKDMGCNVVLDPRNYIAEKKIIEFVNILTQYISNGRYDVVHAHCNLVSAWVTLAAWRAGAKVRISHSHATAHFGKSKLQNLWCYFRRLIISCTATQKLACGKMAGEKMYGVNSNFDILQNGIDVERFTRKNLDNVMALRKFFNIPDNAKVYMNLTRFDYNKNHLFILDIAKEIHEKDPSAIFVLGGNYTDIDSSLDDVKQRVVDYRLEDVVRLSGPRMDIVDMYHLSDCWIFPSIKEGLPFCPIELQAASVPCLVSDTVTKEIDLGLGLIEFMSLEEPPRTWAKTAMTMCKQEIPFHDILAAFQSHDFDIKANTHKLETYYRVGNK